MDVSSRILSELASREAALDAQIEAARAEAARTLEAAQAQAKSIVQQAEQQAQAMQSQHESQVASETQQIREDARNAAGAQAQATRGRAESKLYDAVETIMRAVLP